MTWTAASGTYTVKAIEQAYIGGVAVNKVIAVQASTGSGGTGWSLCDENGKMELTLFGGTLPAVGDTLTFTTS
jgi:hypothetical protein